MRSRLFPSGMKVAAALALQITAAAAAEPVAAPLGSYARAYYDIQLVQSCGLLTAEVERGYELASAERQAAEGLDDAAAQAARIKAGVAFDLEYQNRGLGGNRPWCRQDGKAAALAFFGRFIDERYRVPRAAPRRRRAHRPPRRGSRSWSPAGPPGRPRRAG